MAENILVVDDEHGIQLLLQEVLQNRGYNVCLAATGREALDIIDKELMNLIIIDYNIPIMKGPEVLQAIKDKKIEIPSILISGMLGNEKIKKSTLSIANSTLGKPFDVEELCEQVDFYVSK